MNKYINKKRGFTLIELIVVIAIVGVISGVVLSSLSSARQSTRDTTRKTQMLELSTAINHFFSERGTYPNTSGVWYSSETGDFVDNGLANNGDWIPGLVAAKMIGSLPKDPHGGASTCAGSPTPRRAYLYRSDGAHYKLISNCALEGAYPSSGDSFYDPNRSTPSPWAIQTTDNVTATQSW